jgi:hypothetical protein
MGEKWVLKYVYEEETLVCTSCTRYLRGQTVHLYINVDDEVEDILCDLFWKKNQMEINEQWAKDG